MNPQQHPAAKQSIISVVLAMAVAGTMLFAQACSPPETEADKQSNPIYSGTQRVEMPPDRLEPRPIRPQTDPLEETRKTIAGHVETLDAEPEGADAPALLLAVGNLYRQKLQDPATAAKYYERYIAEFPKESSLSLACLQLGSCYEQLGEQEKLNRLHVQMVELFPEGSSENAFARQQLGWPIKGDPQ